MKFILDILRSRLSLSQNGAGFKNGRIYHGKIGGRITKKKKINYLKGFLRLSANMYLVLRVL
tara:strand:- start:2343 stop:2528 length:186 start_codon:yes stop_codon:yes gene_type:complete